ncbi:MAG: exonuclease domain-containing protein [Gemmatimonadota bacterium]|nr:exonuclease domain-containing protein [Gemmatimonadota bacterium]
MELTRGVYSEPEDTLLTSRALDYLAQGPSDVVDLIGHICSLPGAPRKVAEHMASALFAGRREFVRGLDGRWMIGGLGEGGSGKGEAGKGKPEARNGAGVDGRFSHHASHAPLPLSRFSNEPLNKLSYVVVDTETTGGRHGSGDRITEIAAVVVRDGEIVEVFETLVNPERSIPYFVSQLTNITWEMVKDKPTFDRVAPEVMRVLEGNVFVAHNMMFDWRFVTSELSRSAARKLQGRRLCTVKMARKVLPQLSRRSLDHVARYYGVEIHGRHRAGGDALATAKCMLRMLSDLGDRGCTTWGELEELLRAPAVRRKKRRASGLPTPVLRDTTA